jgi:hypothetical protein
MMKLKLFCLFLALVCALSCKDDTPRMLTLHTPQQVDNSIVLTWEQPDISGFRYYMVMRASDGQNYNPINDITTPTSDAFRKEITSFTDYTYPLEADTLYYKIIAFGNDAMSSDNVLFRNKNKVSLLTGSFMDMFYIEEANKISIVTYSSASPYNILKVFDLQSGQFLPNEAGIYLSSSCTWIMWGHYNGKTEAYHYPSNNTIVCYNAATTQQMATIAIPELCYDPYTTNHKGMIYVCSSNYLYLINRATGNYTRYQLTTRTYWINYLYYNPKDNKLYALFNDSNNNLMIFNLNDDDSVVNDEVFQIADNTSTPVFIENSSLFIVNINGQVKILDMNNRTYHTTDLTNLLSYNIKTVLANNSIYLSAGTNQIYKISTADYKTSDIFTLRVVPQKMFIVDGYLYYFGEYGNNSIMMDKIRL